MNQIVVNVRINTQVRLVIKQALSGIISKQSFTKLFFTRYILAPTLQSLATNFYITHNDLTSATRHPDYLRKTITKIIRKYKTHMTLNKMDTFLRRSLTNI